MFDSDAAHGAETYVLNQQFHLVLLRAADNPLLELIIMPIFAVLSGRHSRGSGGAPTPPTGRCSQ